MPKTWIRATKDWFSEVRLASRNFFVLVIMTMSVFILLNVFSIINMTLPQKPSVLSKSSASQLNSKALINIIALEVPVLLVDEKTPFTLTGAFKFLMAWMKSINTTDPKIFLASEIPGINHDQATLLYGKMTSEGDFPMEYTPPLGAVLSENESKNISKRESSTIQQKDNKKKPSQVNKTILIYHSHNRESWIPELTNVKDPDKAFHPSENVTLLGKRLAKKIEEAGIGTLHSEEDYPATVESFKYTKSYAYSRETVTDAFASHRELEFLFDIHRDSQRRSKTTTTLNNKQYAQVYFVVGEKNPNWEKNMKFAKEIHDRLNELYPGISKGVYSKNSNGNGEYNQSLSPHSTLIEIGGVDNTLEESYRTIDILSKVIIEMSSQSNHRN